MLKTLKKSLHLILALVCSLTLFLAGVFIAPKPIAASASDADFPKVTFRNFGIADGTYTKSNSGDAVGTLGESLDKKMFVGNVKLSKNATLDIGGKSAGKGLSFTISGVALLATFDGTSVARFVKGTAGVSSFEDTEFKLSVSFEKVGTTLKLGIYFNDVLYNNTYYEVKNAASKLGETVSIALSNDSASVSVKSDTSTGFIPNSEFAWLTTDHFYIAEGTYGYTDGSSAAAKGTYPIGLDRTYFAANVTFSALEGASLRYGGNEKDGGLSGFMFSLENGNLVLSDAITGDVASVEFTPADAGLTAFADTQFKLGISMEKIDADDDGSTDDIQLGVWFNDALYKNEFLNLVDYASKIGSTLGVVSTVEGSTVTLGKIAELSAIMPDPTLKKITTYEHFGMADDTYTSRVVSDEYANGFDNTYFSAYVKYEGNGASLYIMAVPSGWTAISFGYNNGNIEIKNTSSGAKVATLTSDVAGVDFTKQFRIGIATTFIDADNDGQKNDVKLGVYFNENLYNGQFFTVKNYLKEGLTYNRISAYPQKSGSKLTLGTIAAFKEPIVSRPLDSSFNKLTFETVAIEDGKYEYNPEKPSALAAKGAYSKTFDGVAFSGTVKFSQKAGAQLGIAMDSSGWSGMRCKINSAGNFSIDHPSKKFTTMTFNAARAGLESFVETEFNLTLTTRYVDCDNDGEKDDVELGVWFNDVLYNDEFINLVDYVKYMGKVVSIYCTKDTWVEVGTRAEFIPVIIPEKLNEDYTLITLSNFGISDATYQKTGLRGKGNYLKTLDKTYFCAFFNYSNDVVATINFASNAGGWTGMGITVSEKQITVKDNSSRTDTYYLSAKGANIDTFKNKDIKLGVSTDYLDLDGDGAEDDVKLGIWVNDYLCNNEYIELIDYRQYIGDAEKGIGAGLGIYVKSLGESGTLKVQSIEIPVDIERFGFTLNWARELALYANTTTTNPTNRPTSSPQTGEEARILKSMIFSCIALGGIVNIDKRGNKR